MFTFVNFVGLATEITSNIVLTSNKSFGYIIHSKFFIDNFLECLEFRSSTPALTLLNLYLCFICHTSSLKCLHLQVLVKLIMGFHFSSLNCWRHFCQWLNLWKIISYLFSWSSYKINQIQDKIGVFVSVVSTKIPFKGTGKEYIGDDITEIASAVKVEIFWTRISVCNSDM